MDKKTVLLCSLILVGMILIPLSTVSRESTTVSNDKLDFVFLLHANQANVPYGDVANDLCYHQVLETQLAHPELHFPVHVSGTLLTDLAWYNQSTLDLLRSGIEAGQFEIIGSTYAQNIMYSHQDDYDNRLQIAAHKKAIKNILEVTPTGFWNPERCWNQQRYVDLIASGNYTYTFVEDQILAQSIPINGYDEYKVRLTSSGDDELLIFNDDKTIIDLVDTVAFTTEPATDPAVVTAVDNLIDYLQAVYQNDTRDDYCVVYGQDMEVWGLWQEEGRNLDGFGYVEDTLSQTTARLDYLFDRLEAESSWLEVTTPNTFLQGISESYTFEEVSPIVDGAGAWMEDPVANEGFDNWFDFSENSTRLNDYRQQFAAARNRLQEIESLITQAASTQNVTPAVNLLDYAKLVFVANQFEFGCIGCYFPWYYRTKSALLTAETALYSLSPSQTVEVVNVDWDLDNNREYILRNDKVLFIFTGQGGRLINCYNIETGEILLANDLPATYSSSPLGTNYEGGTPLSSPIEELTGSDLWDRTDKTYRLRPKAFMDYFNDEPTQWFWKSRNRTVALAPTAISFSLSYDQRTISKTFSLKENNPYRLIIEYTIENRAAGSILPYIQVSFNPGNEAVLYEGQHILDHRLIANQQLLLHNKRSLMGISLEPTSSGSAIQSITEDSIHPMFALGFTMQLPYIQPSQNYTLELGLTVGPASDEPSSVITSSSSITSTTRSTSGQPTPGFLVISSLAVLSLITLQRKQ